MTYEEAQYANAALAARLYAISFERPLTLAEKMNLDQVLEFLSFQSFESREGRQ